MIEKLWHRAKYRNLPGLANVIGASRGLTRLSCRFRMTRYSDAAEDR